MLTYVNPADVLSGFKFVSAFYCVEIEELSEMESMFLLSNEYILVMLDTHCPGQDKACLQYF